MYKPTARVRLLDAKYQNAMASRLRGMDEARAFRYVRRFVAIEPHAGLRLANRVVRSKAYVETLFVDGLRTSNESTVRLWIELLWNRIGGTTVIDLLRRVAADHPPVAYRARYWLANTLVRADVDTRKELDRFLYDFAPRPLDEPSDNAKVRPFTGQWWSEAA